ncbi:MAG TPA: hypothetical protein VMB50_21195 [Myxococcales bacterium]|nr:hypothetical protein [Myxococcales bacterium]
MSISLRHYLLRLGGSLLAVPALLVATAAQGQLSSPREFAAGSLIIPTDNCYQADIGQNTAPKELADPTNHGEYCSGWYVGGTPTKNHNSNGVYANGARRTYGLIWLLIKAGIPVYWVINPNKQNIDDPDLSLNIGSCGGVGTPASGSVVTLVDQSVPASYCGLDELHAVNPVSGGGPTAGAGYNACHQAGVNYPVGTDPLSAGGSVGNVNYRGGPFVIDASNAAEARDLMAWYFANPNATFPTLSPGCNGACAPPIYANPNGPLPTPVGVPGCPGSSPYIDPGHHPLHWSDYTPTDMIPLYPATAFQLDVGFHSYFSPCTDPSMCAYGTWDPLNPNGYVNPWAGAPAGGVGVPFTAANNANGIQNAITYATVNVHQAQVSFFASVRSTLTGPISPIALAAMTDPVHLNTFRLYLEEAGLTFGPCGYPPAAGHWFGAGGSLPSGWNSVNDVGGPAGFNDYFFDPACYPFADRGGSTGCTTPPGWAGPYVESTANVTCAEGVVVNGNDATASQLAEAALETTPGNPATASNLHPVNAAGYTAASPQPGTTFFPEAAGGVMTSGGDGPYGQVLDVIAPQMAAIESLLLPAPGAGNQPCGAPRYSQLWIPHWDAFLCSGPTTEGCPLSSAEAGGPGQTLDYDLPNCGNLGASTTQAGTGFQWLTQADGRDPYCADLVQSFLDATQAYVANGGNMLAECFGASSLEDTVMQSLLGVNGVAQGEIPEYVDQRPSHFMTEWQNHQSLTGYWPTQVVENGGGPPGPPQPPQAFPAPGLPFPNPQDQDVAGGNFCIEPAVAAAAPIPGVPAPPATINRLAVGWPGAQVYASGPSSTVVLEQPAAAGFGGDPRGVGLIQFNAGGGAAPGPTLADGGLASDPDHLVYYGPPNKDGDNPVSLNDPFLQIGDFYFEGIFGLTESWYPTLGGGPGGSWYGGYPPGPSATPDTEVLIRGYPATSAPAWDPVYGSSGSWPNGKIYGDYWIRNKNTAMIGAGTVVYLQGDSFDGQPDGLRMVWSSILNLAFAPQTLELARSAPATFATNTGTTYLNHSPGATYTLQGTFEQSTYDSSEYTPVFQPGGTNYQSWLFPEIRGHFRQDDVAGGANIDECIANAVQDTHATACGAMVPPGSCTGSDIGDGFCNGAPGTYACPAGGGDTYSCASAVAQGTQGSYSTNFQGPMSACTGTNDFWDTSGADWSASTSSELINDNPANITNDRFIFTHLYGAPQAGWTSGIPALAFQNINDGPLKCALFPAAAGCGGAAAGATGLACPDGNAGHCIKGVLQCSGCTLNNPAGSILGGPVASSDVDNLMKDVASATSGCFPLLKDTCAQPGSPAVECLDQCWSNCLSNCGPGNSPPPKPWVPPFPGACGSCAHSCAQSCNTKANGAGGGDCGAGNANSPANFRSLCFPSIGGVDHSTPVLVGAPAVGVTEQLADGEPAACRPTVAYIGSGDGMLHAIFVDGPDSALRASVGGCSTGRFSHFVSGQELWAFIPNQNLPLIPTNGNCERSLYVDGIPVVKDVQDNTGLWHTVLTETLGQGGNHVFALDVTDPLGPLCGTSNNCPAHPGAASLQSNLANNYKIDGSLHSLPFILWEDGDPMDRNEWEPTFAAGQVSFQNNAPYTDATSEGPGYQPAPVAPGAGATYGGYLHYFGKSSTVFMGTLVGAGAHLDVTYVAGQNGNDDQSDGYGRPITLYSDANCGNTKLGGPLSSGPDVPEASSCGWQGEVVYAMDSLTGLFRTSGIGSSAPLVHFTNLYESNDALSANIFRSNGNNDIPAPPIGVSISGRPDTEQLIVPDLDGRLYEVNPINLVSSIVTSGASSFALPLFDVQAYRGSGTDSPYGAGCTLPAQTALLNGLACAQAQAPFDNACAFVPPGTCPGGNGANDPVILCATGGTDWGAQASIIAAIDLKAQDFSVNPALALKNDSANAVFPNQGAGSLCNPLELATCPACIPGTGSTFGMAANDPRCVGRVFGQPFVAGQNVYYATVTGTLTGLGASLDQQKGDGRVAEIGAASCNAQTGANCGICGANVGETDMAVGTGKIAGGVVAAQPNGSATIDLFAASTTGRVALKGQTETHASSLPPQRLLLQQWWDRRTQSSCNPGTPGTCN